MWCWSSCWSRRCWPCFKRQPRPPKKHYSRPMLDFLYISIALISDAPLFAYFCLLFLSLCPCLCAQGCCLLVMPPASHHTTWATDPLTLSLTLPTLSLSLSLHIYICHNDAYLCGVDPAVDQEDADHFSGGKQGHQKTAQTGLANEYLIFALPWFPMHLFLLTFACSISLGLLIISLNFLVTRLGS